MQLGQIQQELKQAQLARDEIKVSVLRLLLAEITNAQIQKRASLEDTEIIALVRREIKKRQEAAAGFRQGGREEQAQKEEAEAKILMHYLPQQLANKELTKIVEDSINDLGVNTLAEMGKVMSVVMSKVGQSADASRVSAIVRELLSPK